MSRSLDERLHPCAARSRIRFGRGRSAVRGRGRILRGEPGEVEWQWQTRLMLDRDAMLDAHVQFELERWSGDRLSQTLEEEVSALARWLEVVQVDQLIPRARLDSVIRRYVCEVPLSDELLRIVEQALLAAHSTALEDDTNLSELLRRDDYDRLVQTAIGMKALRDAITNQITTSEVYSQLIAHVLYRGIKTYLSSESLIARRVPGASSLMRLGQGAISSAAPNLEKSIDKQLTAFVNANIQDSVRESKRYIDAVLDEELLSQVADEVWNVNSGSTVADAAGLVSVESILELNESGRDIWLHLRTAPLFLDRIGSVVDDFLSRHGSRSVMDVLADVGITEAWVVEQLGDVVEPVLARAANDGYMEERIRARLEAFYESYDPSSA